LNAVIGRALLSAPNRHWCVENLSRVRRVAHAKGSVWIAPFQPAFSHIAALQRVGAPHPRSRTWVRSVSLTVRGDPEADGSDDRGGADDKDEQCACLQGWLPRSSAVQCKR